MHFDQKKTYISVEPSISVLDMLTFILFVLDARVFGPFHVYIHVLRLGARHGARSDAGSGAGYDAGYGARYGARSGAGSGAGSV
jgi:hypothetical protein